MLTPFEPDRLSPECARCGRQTPGWQIDVNPVFRRHQNLVVTRTRCEFLTDQPVRANGRPVRLRPSRHSGGSASRVPTFGAATPDTWVLDTAAFTAYRGCPEQLGGIFLCNCANSPGTDLLT